VGLTDLAKAVAASSDRDLEAHYDVVGLVKKIQRYEPSWVAFHGKEATKVVSGALGRGRTVPPGVQGWTVEDARVFVLPSASAANRDNSRLDRKTDRVDWFKELARLLQAIRS
jgi:G:T/U-mismatch repair DNA glycosylase